MQKKFIRRSSAVFLTVALVLSMVMTSAFALTTDTVRNYNWASMPTIKSGSSGGAVRGCQQFLSCKGYTSIGTIDGDFGSKTVSAVKSYQTKYGLTADGIVGKNTWKKMNSQLAMYDEGPVNYSYVVDGGLWADDRFKHQHSSSSSQGSIGSWWVEYGSSYTFALMCS